jgi:tRNA pseudouridine38-40 synthase
LNSKGTIPASAVIKKGERRENPFREKRQFDSTNFPVGGKSSAEDLQAHDGDDDEEGFDKARLADMEG